MKSIRFSAKLLADIVVSETSATTGAHSCLDFLPGASFLGLTASRLYSTLGSAAFNVFHSGKVRFGNAYPLDAHGNPAMPIPLAWHYLKNSEWKQDGTVRTDALFNLIHVDERHYAEWKESGSQPKQVRNGFITRAGAVLDPKKNYRLKSAIDRTKFYRSADSNLFGYESLVSGSSWYFDIQFDDDIGPAIQEQICSVLTASPVRIGRSRSAEYGAVSIAMLPIALPITAPQEMEHLHIYCFSDLALRDATTGMPTLLPAPELFGLPPGSKILPEKTFLRTRSYAPFNGVRKRSDLERQVICKGSVISFTREAGLDLQILQQQLAKGVGMYRHDGLGQVLINPHLLQEVHYSPMSDSQSVAGAPALESMELPALAARLLEKVRNRQQSKDARAIVEAWLRDIALVDGAPANSQWSKLRQIALTGKSRDEYQDLFFGEEGLCSHGITVKAWQLEFNFRGTGLSYAEFIKREVLNPSNDDAMLEQLIWLLGNQMPRRRNQDQNGGRP